MKTPMPLTADSSRFRKRQFHITDGITAASLLLVLLIASPSTLEAARGDNAAATLFNRNATGRSDANAYLLTYLSSLIYPEGLVQRAGMKPDRKLLERLHKDTNYFRQLYVQQTRHLFHDPAKAESTQNRPAEYAFITYDDRQGYDPEAMVIATPTTIFVVFRGTDRVGRAGNGFGYDWDEWIKTNFDPVLIAFGDGVRGKVHKGMLNSLSNIKLRLAGQIQRMGGATKKVWITGHSLGAAHAQIFAVYLAKTHGITAQGVYAIAAPQVGDDSFVSEANGIFAAGSGWQRFEFISDPITMIGPYALGYRRAGIRNHYDSIDAYRFDCPERSPVEGFNVLAGIPSAGASAIGDKFAATNRYRIDLAGGPFCYHHFEWYLAAAYRQLPRTDRVKAPPPLPHPTHFEEACDLATYARALSNDSAEQAAIMAEVGGKQLGNVVEDIQYSLKQVLRNAVGDAVPEGSYFIRNVRGDNYLSWSGVLKNGAGLELAEIGRSSKNNRFHIQRDGEAGYTIRSQDNGRSLFVECDMDELLDSSTSLQLWGANGLMGTHFPNQKWLFYKVSGNRYLIVNYGNRKALDANNKDTSRNGCRIRARRPASNDATQVWILEKGT